MYENLIRNYVNKMTFDDVKKFASIKNINASLEEMQIVYEFIKKHYDKILHEDYKFIDENLKNKISPNLYNRLLILLQEEKKKYL